jgi:transcriptional regulator with XRE-family HTH domain
MAENGLGATLRHYREQAGLTIPQLAEAVAVDRRYLWHLETQSADWTNRPLDDTPPAQPSRDLLIRIAIALHLALDQADDLLMTGGYAPLWAASRPATVSPTTHQASAPR